MKRLTPLISGFAILKPLSRVAPTWLGGGYFGPKVRISALKIDASINSYLYRKMSAVNLQLLPLGRWGSSLRALYQPAINWAYCPALLRRISVG
jgi:hypothetical protein